MSSCKRWQRKHQDEKSTDLEGIFPCVHTSIDRTRDLPFLNGYSARKKKKKLIITLSIKGIMNTILLDYIVYSFISPTCVTIYLTFLSHKAFFFDCLFALIYRAAQSIKSNACLYYFIYSNITPIHSSYFCVLFQHNG